MPLEMSQVRLVHSATDLQRAHVVAVRLLDDEPQTARG
jgi:hypothetical protein